MSSPSLPPTMCAWTLRRRGPAHTALSLSKTYPTPSLSTTTTSSSSSEILIRVSHVALQSSSEALFRTLPALPFPFTTSTTASIPELEFTGTVVAAGPDAAPDVRDIGTRVLGYQTIPDVFLFGKGALAEYVRLPSGQATRLPESADMVARAGLLGSGSTALKMARTGGLKSGDRVLVNGASGSVGQLAVQVAKMRGAGCVVGVASGGNEEVVRGCGADEFIDYRAHDPLPSYLATQYSTRPFDVILDCVGLQSLYVHSPAYLKPSGAVINIGSMAPEGTVFTTLYNWAVNTWWPAWLGGVPRRYSMFSTPPSKEDAVVLVRMVDDGKLKIRVDSVFGMEEAIAAYERVGTKRARGRVVVKVERD